MRKTIISMALLIAGTVSYAQNSDFNNLVAIQSALPSGDFFHHLTGSEWLYLWDLSKADLEDEFVLLEIKEANGTSEPRRIAIGKETHGPSTMLVNYRPYYNGIEEDRFYIFPSDGHGELFYTYQSAFMELRKGKTYGRRYELNSNGTLSRGEQEKFYYSELGADGKVYLFDESTFSADDIINSNRTIRPRDPWKVTYQGGKIHTITNNSTSIKFDPHDNYILFTKVERNYNNVHNIIHRIGHSEPDEKGRWTKEILYDYDVIDDRMVPAYIIKRSFIPAGQLERYKKARFDATKVTLEDNTPNAAEDTEAIPFTLVEVKPIFKGGDANNFAEWVNKHLEYPEIAKENGVQGRVIVSFKVNKDGSVSDVNVFRGVDAALDREAVRVVSSSPKWEPATQRGKPVAVTYIFPVIFQLR